MTQVNEEGHVLHLVPRAVDTLRAMERQAVLINDAWKHIKPQYGLEALRTLATQTVRMMIPGFGTNTKVYRDGDLSLFIQTESGFVYGMIFHRSVRPAEVQEGDYKWTNAPVMGRFCVAALDTNVYCGEPYDKDGPTCEGHEPSLLAMPVPGEWSFHS